jgi:hypothetical protein
LLRSNIFVKFNLNDVFDVVVFVGVDDVCVVDVDVAADGEVALTAASSTPDLRQDLALLGYVLGVLDPPGESQNFRTLLDCDAALVTTTACKKKC